MFMRHRRHHGLTEVDPTFVVRKFAGPSGYMYALHSWYTGVGGVGGGLDRGVAVTDAD